MQEKPMLEGGREGMGVVEERGVWQQEEGEWWMSNE